MAVTLYHDNTINWQVE